MARPRANGTIVQRNAEYSPYGLRISIASNLTGVKVGIGEGPCSSDPLGVRSLKQEHFPDVGHAIEALPRLAREALQKACDDNSPPTKADAE